jgi:hypothetical protein
MTKQSISSLIKLGFDLTEFNKDSGNFVIGCSQCKAVVIWGMPTHEQGCPNIPKTGLSFQREERDQQ